MRFQAFLALSLFHSFLLVISAQNEQCGWQADYKLCPNDYCCSRAGYCGITDLYCGPGCQSQCHDLPSFITESTYNEMFPNQKSKECPSQGFYTYEAFLKAAITSFPDFASVGDDGTRRREIAAFLAQTSHETAGPKDIVPLPEDQYTWGYCNLSETNPPSNYCDPHYDCPMRYYGRGPIQLRWNVNYLHCGEAIEEDLINDPGLLVSDAVISFKSAFLFWMTPEITGKPTCHEVITGQWTPTGEDESQGWLPGFGLITNIINGANECGNGPNAMGENRIGYFTRYCGLLNTTTGENLDCYEQTPIGPFSLAKTM